jgi:hypothetical protein
VADMKRWEDGGMWPDGPPPEHEAFCRSGGVDSLKC